MSRKHTTHRTFQVHYRWSQPRSSKAPLIGLATAGIIGGIVWQAPGITALLPAPAPTVTVTTTATPTQPAPTPSLDTQEPEGPTLQEGHDYTFLETSDGEPLTWGCDTPILIATEGTVPTGAQTALEMVVHILREASNLPLQVAAPNSPADITIYYAPPGTTRGHITLDGDDTLGKAGPRSINGQIRSGIAILRNDAPTADPATPDGQAVLMHELAHTLGLSHAHPSTDELMTPTHAPGVGPVLGPGDKAGLEKLGCP